MRILIATDAWLPQVNGVVRTLGKVVDGLQASGHEVKLISPQGRRSMPLPGYPEIPLTLISRRSVAQVIAEFAPQSIHIATEGPVGHAVRSWCIKNKRAFTTSFHTRFAEYASLRFPVPGVKTLAYAFLRRFHAPSRCVMVPTASVAREMKAMGFRNLFTWTRGVDHDLFRPTGDANPASGTNTHERQPVLISVGRIAIEKGLEDFLEADVEGSKVIIGYKHGEDLVAEICKGDVFVFPSRTDTFGLVIIEAMACGLPVAAFPVTGPIDIVEDGVSGALDEDLGKAINRAQSLCREKAIGRAQYFTYTALTPKPEILCV